MVDRLGTEQKVETESAGPATVADRSAGSPHRDLRAERSAGPRGGPALLGWVPKLGVWAWSFGAKAATIIPVLALGAVSEIVLPLTFAAVLAMIFKPCGRDGPIDHADPDASAHNVTTAPVPVLSAAERRRRLAVGLLRALAITVILGAGYYLAPLDRLSSVPLWLTLAIGLLALAVVAAIQVRAVIRSRYPALKAVEALAATAPLFLLLFAAAYFLVAQEDPSNFTVETLTRTDSLYFTVTIFATVGFGDISPASEAARILVMAQMILDLIVLGLGIRIFVGAIEVGRQKTSNGPQTPDGR